MTTLTETTTPKGTSEEASKSSTATPPKTASEGAKRSAVKSIAKTSKAVKKRASGKELKGKKAVSKVSPKPKTTKQAKQTKQVEQPTKPKHVDRNPYRAGSFYATCFDCLSKLGSKKPVTRKELLTAYCNASGKDVKRAKYDLAVILSPRSFEKGGGGHRSSKHQLYWVERLADSMVKLHMAE